MGDIEHWQFHSFALIHRACMRYHLPRHHMGKYRVFSIFNSLPNANICANNMELIRTHARFVVDSHKATILKFNDLNWASAYVRIT